MLFSTSITRTKLTDEVISEVILWTAGLKSLIEAVSVTMATLMWKARKNMYGHTWLYVSLKINCLSKTPDQNTVKSMSISMYQDTQNYVMHYLFNLPT